MKCISRIEIIVSNMRKRFKQLIIAQWKQMNIFTICNKGKDYFIKVLISDAEAILCAVKGGKGFFKAPERCDDSLKAGSFLKEHIEQIRTGFSMVPLNPCAGIKIEIIQEGLFLSHLKDIIAEFVRRFHIAIKYFAGIGNGRLFYMEGSL